MNTKSTEKAFSFFGWIFILLIFIILASVLSIFFMGGGEKTANGKSVDFWLYKHSPQITGEKRSYFVFVKNNSNRDIENVKINLDLPSSFELISSEKECPNSDNCEWGIESIKKGTLKEVEFKGKLFGQPGKKYFSGGLEFNLKGFSSRFYKSFEEEVDLNSPLVFDWEIPTKAGLGENIKSNLYLDNDSKEVLPEVKVRINVPENFVVQKYKIEQDNIESSFEENTLTWVIKNLDFKKEKELSFSGFFKNANKRQHFFKAQAIVPFNEEDFVQKQEKKLVAIGQGVDINLKVADKNQGPIVAKWGESLPINLSYYNTNEKTIEDLDLDIEILGERYLKEKPEFHWQANNLKKGNGVEKKENINIVSGLEALKSNFSHSKITLLPKAKGKFKDYSNYWTLEGEPIEVKMSTNLSLRAEAKMFSDEGLKIGQGPMPLKANKETKVWIFWNLKNTTNDLKDVLVKTELPENVKWTGDVESSVGDVSFQGDKNLVKWEIPTLTSFSGGAHSLIQAKFEVSITPKENDLVRTPLLTKKITIQAKDEFCETNISDSKPALDADLEKVLGR